MENKLGISGIDNRIIISALETALAEEYLAWYAYMIAAPFLTGPNHLEIEELYKEHAKDEFEDHACWLMDRINKLGGKPMRVISPNMLNEKAKHKYITPPSNFNVIASIDQNIKAEQGAIETYTQLEKLTRDKDVVTNQKIKEILADEQDHLQNLIEWKDACQNCKSPEECNSKKEKKLSYLNYFE